MKHLSFHVTNKSRGNTSASPDGQSAVASAAYITGTSLTDTASGRVHNYTAKEGVIDHWVALPPGALDAYYVLDTLTNAMEAAEHRRDSAVGREWRLALPVEFPHELRKEALASFVAELIKRYKVACIVAMHRPSREGDQRNFHAHVLTSTRECASTGFVGKTRALDQPWTSTKEVDSMRKIARGIFNDLAKREDYPAGYECVSFKKLLIDQAPTQHKGPAATAMERRGVMSQVALRQAEIIRRADDKMAANRRLVAFGTAAGDLLGPREWREALAAPVHLLTPMTPLHARAEREFHRPEFAAGDFDPGKLSTAHRVLCFAWIRGDLKLEPAFNPRQQVAVEHMLGPSAVSALRRWYSVRRRRASEGGEASAEICRRLLDAGEKTVQAKETDLANLFDQLGIPPAAACTSEESLTAYLERVEAGELEGGDAARWFLANKGLVLTAGLST